LNSLTPVSTRIPEPKGLPFVGHSFELDHDKPLQSIATLAHELGPIYRLSIPGKSPLIVLSQLKQLEEAFDETRFEKALPKGLEYLRPLALDGLFTAYASEPNWGKAHRILMPAFSTNAMRQYHDMMLDIATQMVEKWARLPAEHAIDIPADMTRLTLDVIALCGFGYRFNSFYLEGMHPFVDSMVRSLSHAMRSSNRPDFVNQLLVRDKRTFAKDIEFMHKVVDDVIVKRKREPKKQSDLLSLMLNAQDPETGETLSDENIRYQIVTFLIAGHETTSSLLSFALYFLMRDPEVLAKARREVDAILTEPGQLPTYEETRGMQYLEQILFESLRLWPTAPGFALRAKEDTTIDGFPISTEDILLANLTGLHRDPNVWREPERFDPDRFAPEEVARRPIHAWKPFGNGLRACIGRQFAIHEAKMVLSVILKRFELQNTNPGAPLEVCETLTYKPEGLSMRVTLRDGLHATQLLHRTRGASAFSEQEVNQEEPIIASSVDGHRIPLTVAFGSNMGSTRSFAQSLARDATTLGYQVTLCPLNDCVENIPTEGAFLVVCASYNGYPPDNANRFYQWLETCGEDVLTNVQFAVFGCGHKDWAATYQAVPRQIDAWLERAGATRLHERGEGDAREDIESELRQWKGLFWPLLQEHFALPTELPEELTQENTLYVEELTPPPPQHAVSHDACPMEIVQNRELVDMGWSFSRSKRHLSVKLPKGSAYRAGDYLVVQPVNAMEEVEAFASKLQWDLEQLVVLRAEGPATLPLNRPLSLRSLLLRYVELRKPLSQRQLKELAEFAMCPPEKHKLLSWSKRDEVGKKAFATHVASKRLSLFDLVQMFPSLRPPLQATLSMMEPLMPRYYSIASSPMNSPEHCDLLVSVLQQPALSGQGDFKGVCSNYLAQASVGSSVLAWIQRPSPSFSPPEDSAVPMIMIGAGTGVAPFRGFIQERSAQSQPEASATSMLFFGCDHPEVDFLYKEEFKCWEEKGLLSVFPAFSELPDGDIRFVQHRLWKERKAVQKSLAQGAAIYICGDGRYMAPAVLDTLCRIYMEEQQCSRDEADSWLLSMRQQGRLHEDVWAG